jgi:hypothetical protein
MRKSLFILSSAIVSINSLQATDSDSLEGLIELYAPAQLQRHTFDPLHSAQSFSFNGHLCSPVVRYGQDLKQAHEELKKAIPQLYTPLTSYYAGGLTRVKASPIYSRDNQLLAIESTYEFTGRPTKLSLTFEQFRFSVAVFLSPADTLWVNGSTKSANQAPISSSVPSPEKASPIVVPASSSAIPVPPALPALEIPPAPAMPAAAAARSASYTLKSVPSNLQDQIKAGKILKKVVQDTQPTVKYKDTNILQDALVSGLSKVRKGVEEQSSDSETDDWSETE